MNKSNNKLLLVFTALLILFAMSKVLKKKKSAGSFDSEIVKIDADAIDNFKLNKSDYEISFIKSEQNWEVEKEGVKYKAKHEVIQSFLSNLGQLKAEQLISRSEESWEKYELTDQLATRVIVPKTSNGEPLDLWIGKMSIQQPTGGFNQQNANNISAKTYIRLNNENEVFVSNSFIGATAGASFNDWRDNQLLKTDKNNITTIEVKNADGLNTTLSKSAIGWQFGDGQPVDSTFIDKYLNTVSNFSLNTFSENVSAMQQPFSRVTISGNNMGTTVLSILQDNEGQFYITSSELPNVVFGIDSIKLFTDILISQ